MLTILVIEDNQERIESLRTLYGAHGVTDCSSAEEAVNLLSRNAFDLVHLDFDLESDLTGEHVAHFLAGNSFANPVVIHSENPRGVARIRSWLPNAIVVPISKILAKSNATSRFKALLATVDQIDGEAVGLALSEIAGRD